MNTLFSVEWWKHEENAIWWVCLIAETSTDEQVFSSLPSSVAVDVEAGQRATESCQAYRDSGGFPRSRRSCTQPVVVMTGVGNIICSSTLNAVGLITSASPGETLLLHALNTPSRKWRMRSWSSVTVTRRLSLRHSLVCFVCYCRHMRLRVRSVRH